jgi:hypothetical protein
MASADLPRDLSDLIGGEIAVVTSPIGPGKTGSVQVATAIGFIEVSAISDDLFRIGDQALIVALIDATVVDPVSRVQRLVRQVTVRREYPKEGF